MANTLKKEDKVIVADTNKSTEDFLEPEIKEANIQEIINHKKSPLAISFNLISILGLIGTLVFVIYGYQKGIFSSSETLKGFLNQMGSYGPLVFVLIQIIQVVVPIIPGGISCLVGVIMFGPVYGFLYNYLGIVIGSAINFLLARYYGKSFVLSIVSQKTYDKHMKLIDKGTRFDKIFATAIFMPLAPDDFLCLLAGLTKMSFKRFMAIIIICKPPSILAFSLGLASIFHWLVNFF